MSRANLSSSSSFFFFLFFTCCRSAAVPDVQQVEVEAGQDAPLQCQAPRDSDVLMLEWVRSDLGPEDYVFFYREKRSYQRYQHPSFRGRVELRDSSSLEDGDVSVILQNTSISDTGTYRCLLTVSSGRGFRVLSLSVNLTVTASGFNHELPELGRSEHRGGGKDGAVPTAASVSAVLLVVGFILGVIFYRKYKTPSEPRVAADQAPQEPLVSNIRSFPPGCFHA